MRAVEDLNKLRIQADHFFSRNLSVKYILARPVIHL